MSLNISVSFCWRGLFFPLFLIVFSFFVGLGGVFCWFCFFFLDSVSDCSGTHRDPPAFCLPSATTMPSFTSFFYKVKMLALK